MVYRAPFMRWSRWLGAAALACGLLACAGGPKPAPASAVPSDGVPVAPLMIAMPLDRAGHRVDVIFDIPEPPQGERARGYFLGLRMLFAPGMGRVQVFDAHPVEVRVTLHRLEDGVEMPVQLVRRTDVSKGHEPSRFEAIPLKDDIAIARGEFTELSDAPQGTPDASTYVMSFAGPRGDAPGRYRLRLETLNDIPQLQGVKGFLAFEQGPKR